MRRGGRCWRREPPTVPEVGVLASEADPLCSPSRAVYRRIRARLLRRRQNQVARPMARPTTTTLPTPMPALAPVPRPSPLPSCGTAETPLPVGTVVISAHCGPEPPTKVQLCVTAQQPPPRLPGHRIWLVVQPGGMAEMREVKELLLVAVLVRMHCLLLAQVCPKEQQPPPRADGQPNCEVPVHCRGQQAG